MSEAVKYDLKTKKPIIAQKFPYAVRFHIATFLTFQRLLWKKERLITGAHVEDQRTNPSVMVH